MGSSTRAKEPIPDRFATIEEAGAFWDTHDLTDYPDEVEEAEFEVDVQRRRYLVALAPELSERLLAEAQRQGLHTETLVNLWLTDRLRNTTP